MAMTLDVLPGRLAVCRLAPDAPLAPWMGEGVVSSLSRTTAELSVVCAEASVPEGVRVEAGWRALALRGPIDFALTGVLVRILQPLAEADVGIFALSTYDTDLVLVKEVQLADAVAALRDAGLDVVG
ncbi:amino acid-binding protein [Rubrivirga sp. SAORIC476]|nr:amino acid-binding protein [Rubrivirga sp. SAORIC476]